MTQPTRLPAPGSGQPHHLSPIDWWAIGQGVGAIGGLLDQRRDDRAARQWQDRLDAAHSAFLADRRVKLAEVATPSEMTAYDAMMSRAEQSYAEMALYGDLVRRWCDENPTAYPSQDQHRQAGLLCRCDPNKGHSCSAQAIASDSAWTPRVADRARPGEPARLWSQIEGRPRRAVSLLLWLPLVIWGFFMTLVGPIATGADSSGGDVIVFICAALVLGAMALWSTWFMRSRRIGLEAALGRVSLT